MSTMSHTLPHYVIGIDPSLGNLGMSIYSLNRQKTEKVYFIHQPLGGSDWMLRATQMAMQVEHEIVMLSRLDMNRVFLIIETPSNWFTEKGMDSKNAGDIQKLYWFVGCIAHACAHYPVDELWTVIPSAWKGQTPKPIMVDRACTHLEDCNVRDKDGNLVISDGINPIPHDAAEAVLLAKIAAAKISSNLKEGKGWSKIWSHGDPKDILKVRTWQAT
jgi:hypothetical protein